MKKRIAKIFMVVLCLATVGLVVYIVKTGPRRQIMACYARLDAAITAKDLAAYMDLLSADYTERRLNEKPMNRAQAEANYKTIMEDWISYRSQQPELDEFQAYTDTANAIVNRAASGEMVDRKGLFGVKGAKHAVESDTMNVDLWQRTESGWKLKHHTVSLVKVTVDGKQLAGEVVHDDDRAIKRTIKSPSGKPAADANRTPPKHTLPRLKMG